MDIISLLGYGPMDIISLLGYGPMDIISLYYIGYGPVNTYPIGYGKLEWLHVSNASTSKNLIFQSRGLHQPCVTDT